MIDYTSPSKDHTALLTIDMQNDFVLPGARAEIEGSFEIVPTIQKLVQAFRTQSLPIIHVVRLYLSGGSNVDLCRRKAIEDGKEIVKPGSEGAQLVNGIKPSSDFKLNTQVLLSGELQVAGKNEWVIYKSRWGAFYSTRLEQHLCGLGVTTIVVSGCNFPNCPRTTVYEASERDFRIIFVTDAVSGLYDRGNQELRNIGVSVMTTRECIERFLCAT